MVIYDISVKDSIGAALELKAMQGKVVLIVNVASKCGFTPQYEGLEALSKKYYEQGLRVLGFPCNQFGEQEAAGDSEIQSFCKLNYGVSFPVMAKIEVNGDGADPLYKFLKSAAPGLLGLEAIKWNFTKFLVSRDAKIIKRYAPTFKPESLTSDIESMLK